MKSLRMKRNARSFSDYRKNLWVLTLEGVPAIIMLTLLGGPFLTGYLLHLGATSQQIGLVLSMASIVNVVQVFVAYWMQRITNRYWVLVTFSAIHRIGWAATGLIPFIFPSDYWIPVFLTMYSIAFLGNAISGLVWTSLVGDMVPAGIRGRYMGIRNTMLNALGSLVLFIGGQALDRFPGQQGFNLLFIAIGICTVLNIIAFANYPKIPLAKSTESEFLPMLKKPFQDRAFLRAALFISLWLFLQGIIVPLFSYVMLHILHISYNWISIITVVQTAFMMISFYIWGNLNMKYSNKRLLYCTLPIIASACMLWSFISVFPAVAVLIAIHALLGIGIGGFNQLSFNFIIGDTPKSERPMFIAVYSALTGFAAFLGPILGGWLYEMLREMPAWMQSYGLSTLVGFMMLLLGLILGRVVLRDSYAPRPTEVARELT
ncbi:MFS transporter [Paenibacillus terrigena]|uniref:MFS transporter n=1 Tax=Paenibacillus terrigena TaxID=369333 RepID=UPI00037091B4|nr:MFS transporter [Paenibacillus terrigena]